MDSEGRGGCPLLTLLAEQPSGFANPICFHAQQAVEKFLKGYLTWQRIACPKTHDLERLLVLVETADRDLAEFLADTSILTPYGVEVRYPGDHPKATEQEAEEAVRLVRKTQDAILAVLPALE
ncbi:MAG: HEPN domain-containing protein [Candidatus Hydrogenedentes bacterium]|nr:HEPN domain-containing protein [Candidatus Hydrogenedentota bacterium]